jgi:hypothetical protein
LQEAAVVEALPSIVQAEVLVDIEPLLIYHLSLELLTLLPLAPVVRRMPMVKIQYSLPLLQLAEAEEGCLGHTQEVTEVLVAVLEEPVAVVALHKTFRELEILHQPHHHKEITVVQDGVILVWAVEAVEAVQTQWEVLLQAQPEEMVEMGLPLQ